MIQGPLELLAPAFLHASWNALLERERHPQGAVLAVLASGLLFAATLGRATYGAVYAVARGGYHLCYDRALREGASPAPVFAVALAVALPLAWAAVLIPPG